MKHPVGDKNALIIECSLQKNSLVSESRANDGQTAPYSRQCGLLQPCPLLLDRRSETPIFVDPAAFVGTDHARRFGVTPGRAIPVSLPLPIPPSAHATLWQPVYNTSGGQPRRTSSDPARPRNTQG